MHFPVDRSSFHHEGTKPESEERKAAFNPFFCAQFAEEIGGGVGGGATAPPGGPMVVAFCSGVCPNLFFTSTLAPLSTRNCTTESSQLSRVVQRRVALVVGGVDVDAQVRRQPDGVQDDTLPVFRR